MQAFAKRIVASGLLLLTGCSPVKNLATNEYNLTAFSARHFTSKPHSASILVTQPDAAAAFQTDQMLYMKKPFQLEPFAKNVWVSQPAEMIYPLMVQSLQASGYFSTVASSPYNQGAMYRLDTQLLDFKQNFIKYPSVFEFTAKVVLTQVKDNRSLGSQVIHLDIKCPKESPYGGVVAANEAAYQFTERVTGFVMGRVGYK